MLAFGRSGWSYTRPNFTGRVADGDTDRPSIRAAPRNRRRLALVRPASALPAPARLSRHDGVLLLSVTLLHEAGLRAFRPEDAAAVNAIENAERRQPRTVAEWWRIDPHRTGREVFVRWVLGDPAIAYL